MGTMKSTCYLRTNFPRIMFLVGGAHRRLTIIGGIMPSSLHPSSLALLTFYLSSTPTLYLIGGILPRILKRFTTTLLDWDWRIFLFLHRWEYNGGLIWWILFLSKVDNFWLRLH